MIKKKQLDEKLLMLKEVLCDLNPEALEEIERDCEHRVNYGSDSNQEVQAPKEKGKADPTKAIKKRSDKKKKRRERLFYD